MDTNDYTKSPLQKSLIAYDLGAHLIPEQLEDLSKHLSEQNFTSGNLVAQAKTPAQFVGLILAGEAEVEVDSLKRAGLVAGDFFGEAMFSSQALRTADVRATTDMTIAILTISAFEALLNDDLRLAMSCKSFFGNRYTSHKKHSEHLNWVDDKHYIALVAHNAMKPVLVDFVSKHKDLLQKLSLVATGTTGSILHKETGLLLSRKVQSGPLGGDQAIGAMIAAGSIRAIIFFRDPLSAHPHHADIEALGRLADVYQVPFATNPATAEAILANFEIDPLVTFQNPAFTAYKKEQNQVVSSAP
jgi:methylglyoxal synthase